MADRLPISVCMIAGNEAARIRRALESVAGWSAEILVVLNDDVNDGTDRIAEAQGARVFREPWKGYVAQRNSVLDKATQEWILFLDADEEVAPPLRDEIRRAISGTPAAAGFSFPRLTQFCGRWIRHGDWYPDRLLRLWRRGQGRWVGGEIHETAQVNGPIGRLNGDLLHYLGEAIDPQIRKICVYSEAFARERLGKGARASGFDLVLRPAWRFWRTYLFKLGFLDGWQGLYIAWMTAFYTATRYAKIRTAEPSKTS